MKVFISWSGETSLRVAQVFRDWLPSVIQSIVPYVSSEDIDKGARWSTDIAKELENSTFGILCVTKDNMEAPWLSFEAGALSKTMEKTFVTPFLFDIKTVDLQGPILQFQSTVFEKEDIKKMVKTLNKACENSTIDDTRLEKAFEVWYPTLEKDLNAIKSVTDTKDKKVGKTEKEHSSEMLEEILELTRINQKLLKTPDARIINELQVVKDSVAQIQERTERSRRISRVNYSETMRCVDAYWDLYDRTGNMFCLLMTLSVIKDEFPWLYAMGEELIETLKSTKSKLTKAKALEDFKDIFDFAKKLAIRSEKNMDNMLVNRDLFYYISRYLEDFYTRINTP